MFLMRSGLSLFFRALQKRRARTESEEKAILVSDSSNPYTFDTLVAGMLRPDVVGVVVEQAASVENQVGFEVLTLQVGGEGFKRFLTRRIQDIS